MIRRFAFLLVGLLVLALQGSSIAATSITLARREHPFLFANARDLDRARQRISTHDWARKAAAPIFATARKAREEFQLPPEGGQWGQYGACEKCGHGLRRRGDAYTCTACGAEYRGWPYDQIAYAEQHRRLVEEIRDCALAYALTSETKYARTSRDRLLAYADRYTSYALHDVRNRDTKRGGRIHAQTLSEATSLVQIAWGYDLVFNTLTAAERQQIEEGLLRPAAAVIRRNDMGLSNWQTWHNSAIAAIGFVIGDDELVDFAINGKSGLVFQLDHCVRDDGFWHEGTPGYHFYALTALQWTLLACEQAGIDFWKHPAVKGMYDAPLRYTFPDLTFPAVNDSSSFSLTGRNEHYELAYAHFGDPAYTSVLSAAGRANLQALMWGVEKLVSSSATEPTSRVFDGIGAVVMRLNSPDLGPLYAHLDYGPHGGGHGHADKLSLILYGLGRQLAPDPGSISYSVPLHKQWYWQTISHNIVTVDGASQVPAEGSLLFFRDSARDRGFVAASAVCDTAVTGVLMRRTPILTRHGLVDVFDVTSDESHVYDFAWHNFGRVATSLPLSSDVAAPGTKNGYQHIDKVRGGNSSGPWHVDFVLDTGGVRLSMAGGGSTEIFTGEGRTGNPPEPCPMILARRAARSTTFVSMVEPYRKKPVVTSVELRGTSGTRTVELTIGGKIETYPVD